MSRSYIGLGISAGEVRAVLLRGGTIVWRDATPVSGDATLDDAITRLLAGAPRPRLRRPSVVAAIGPSAAQVKRLAGMAGVRAQHIVTQIVQANVGRFFLRNGVPLVTPFVHRGGDAWWGAAIEAPSVTAVQRACATRKLRFMGCLPTVAALSRGVREGVVQWDDGVVRATLVVTHGEWTEARRDVVASAVRKGPADPDARFADAIAAARCAGRRSLPLLVTPPRPLASPAGRRTIVGGLVVLLLIAAALALAAPGIAAERARSRDARQLDALQASMAAWAPLTRDLRAATAGLDEIARFTRTRRSVLLMLRDVSAVLPESTAIVSLRVDSAGGSMTMLSRAAAGLVRRLGSVPTIHDVRVGGPVSRDNIGGVELQRVTVRFRIAP